MVDSLNFLDTSSQVVAQKGSYGRTRTILEKATEEANARSRYCET